MMNFIKKYKNKENYFMGTAKQNISSDLSSKHVSELLESYNTKYGVVLGVDPENGALVKDNGFTNVFIEEPDWNCKKESFVIPTLLNCDKNVIVYDLMGKAWKETADYRRETLQQNVILFNPLDRTGCGLRWNPFSEIRFKTVTEFADIRNITQFLVNQYANNKFYMHFSFWNDAAISMLNGIVLHLLYKNDKEQLPTPNLSDVLSFITPLIEDIEDVWEGMRTFPHITPKEFLEEEYDAPVTDAKGELVCYKDGHLKVERKRYVNPLRQIYGEFYVKDMDKFNAALGLDESECVHNIDELQKAIKKAMEDGKDIDWETRDDANTPFHRLLTHPCVAACANNMKNLAGATYCGIVQTAQTALAIYQDPVIAQNTAVSDFSIRDILESSTKTSLYVMDNLQSSLLVTSVAGLLLNIVATRFLQLTEPDPTPKFSVKKHFLFMLDDLLQLPYMKALPLLLTWNVAIGIKVCIGCADREHFQEVYMEYANECIRNCNIQLDYRHKTNAIITIAQEKQVKIKKYKA